MEEEGDGGLAGLLGWRRVLFKHRVEYSSNIGWRRVMGCGWRRVMEYCSNICQNGIPSLLALARSYPKPKRAASSARWWTQPVSSTS